MPVGKNAMQNIGVRLPDDLIQKLEVRSTVTGEDKAGICRNAIALALGEPVPPSSDERFQDIIDRLSRLESLILQICPFSEGQEDGSKSVSAQLDGQELPEIVHLPLSVYVNEENLIICPHCGSLDSDWADDDEAAQVRSILCHQCGQTSHFDLSA